MKPILLLSLLGCMLMDAAMSISTSKSCTMVNGEWQCEEMTNKEGNYAGSSSSSYSGPEGSKSSRYVDSKSGYGDSSKFSSFASRTDHDKDPHEGGRTSTGSFASAGGFEDFPDFGIPPSNDFGDGGGGAFSYAGDDFPVAGAGFPFQGAGFPFQGVGFPFGGVSTFAFGKKRK